MTKSLRHCLLLLVLAFLVSAPARAQSVVANNNFNTSVHLLVGQAPVRVNPGAGLAAFYDAPVVQNRSYCAEATASDTETAQTSAALTVFRNDQVTIVGAESASKEPIGIGASRICFVAPATETFFIRLFNTAGAGTVVAEYSLRFVETTLWANWFYVGGDYSSYAIIRNTTNTAVTVDFRWFAAATGQQVGAMLNQNIAANGVLYFDARTAMSCGFPTPCSTQAGSVQVAHAASPEAIVGSDTTLSASTGLSFDTLFFQRKPW